MALVWTFARRIWDRATAFRAGLFYCLPYNSLCKGKQAQLDELVTFLLPLVVMVFCGFINRGRLALVLGWFAALVLLPKAWALLRCADPVLFGLIVRTNKHP